MSDKSIPKITVLIPLFNKRAYVGDSLRSVARQSFSDFEIVVVDDGSTDDGASVVMSLGIPQLRVVTQPNAGVSAARNRGLAESRSSLVAFLDADDVWQRDHLHHLWQLHAAFPDACLMANSFLEVRNNVQDRIDSQAITYRRVGDFIEEAASGRAWIFTSAAMVRRDTCLAIGGFRIGESRGEDVDLWIRMALSYPVAMSSYIGTFYRRVAGSLTSSHQVSQPDVAMRTITSALEDKCVSDTRRQNLDELYSRMALAHAADSLLQRQPSVARRFIREAARSKMYANRRRALSLLTFLPRTLVTILFKLRSLINAR